jgi:broad specificity phosphatase PhoE
MPSGQTETNERGEQKWPDTIWLVRHGESAGNVARDAAVAAKQPRIAIETRDVDTPLSSLGHEQAAALGRWFAQLHDDRRPTVLLSSPYVRARLTAQKVIDLGGVAPEARLVVADERLREKEFGILDRLTKFGIAEKYPDLAEQREHVGKFYFRPPGGESWCDVILRLRNVIDTISREYRRERVLIVAHQVIVNCFRYLFERLDERRILEIDQQQDVPNCSITSYEFDPRAGKNGKLVAGLVNFVAPLEAAGTPVTVAPDVPVAPKS